jgi:long-chain acyl-CoA synthetase
MRRALVAGFCMACPESPDTVQQDLREIGPTFYFAPPRVFENMLTRVMIRMEDAGYSSVRCSLFHRRRAAIRREDPERRSRCRSARLLYAARRNAGLRPLKNVLGFSRMSRRLYRGRGDRAGDCSVLSLARLNLKQLYGQTEAFLYVTCQPDGEIRPDTVGRPRRMWISASRIPARCSSSRPACSRLFQGPEKTAEAMTPDGYVKTGDAGFFDAKTGHLKIIDRAKDVGKLNGRTLFAPKYIENKLKFYPNIKEAVALRRRARFRRLFHQYRPHRRRQLGRTQQRRLWLLSGAGRASARL